VTNVSVFKSVTKMYISSEIISVLHSAAETEYYLTLVHKSDCVTHMTAFDRKIILRNFIDWAYFK
jgi:hypothetical protein